MSESKKKTAGRWTWKKQNTGFPRYQDEFDLRRDQICHGTVARDGDRGWYFVAGTEDHVFPTYNSLWGEKEGVAKRGTLEWATEALKKYVLAALEAAGKSDVQ